MKHSLQVASSLEGRGKQITPIIRVSRPPEPVSTGHGRQEVEGAHSAGDVLNGEGCSPRKGQKGTLSSICEDSQGAH